VLAAEQGPAAERGQRARLNRRLRLRAVVAVGSVVVGLTIASFAFNLATDGPPGRPAGMHLATGGGFETRYLAWGRTGTPVVLLPGAFETADTFADLGPVLGATHRVFAIDLSGTGYSSVSPPFDAAHLASQVLAFLRAMHLTGRDAPVLVGHSSGAAVAGMAALLDRQAVSGVVFLDGDALPLPVPPIAGWLLINPFRTTLVRLALSSGSLINRIYQSQCGPACPPLSAAGVRTWQQPLQQPGFLDVVGYNLRHGIPSMTGAQLRALRAIHIAELVIYGRNDPQIGPADAAATAARIGAPAPVAIPGRHLTMISSPRQLAAALSAFTHQTSS
jgi:pimeloyl-ACP methyl ester carboxylesterase